MKTPIYLIDISNPFQKESQYVVKIWYVYGCPNYVVKVIEWYDTSWCRHNNTLSFQPVCDIRWHTPVMPWASCQMRKIASAHAPGMPGTFSPPPRVNDPDMHHGTCLTHVPWCMPGSLTRGFLWSRRRGKTLPAFPAHAQPAILRIW